MSAQEKLRWKNWAECLRQEMMTGLIPEVTKSVETIGLETSTTKAESTLRSERFWRACQQAKSPNDILAKAGFEIDFELGEGGKVHDVTLRLNETWMSILRPVMDRHR